HNQATDNDQKDYKVRYKALKAELALLTQKIEAVSKHKKEKGFFAESFDKDEESLSLRDKGTTKVKAFIDSTKDELSVGKNDARLDP
nr:hypothetical protein [Tanacetum cinerariifolium]